MIPPMIPPMFHPPPPPSMFIIHHADDTTDSTVAPTTEPEAVPSDITSAAVFLFVAVVALALFAGRIARTASSPRERRL